MAAWNVSEEAIAELKRISAQLEICRGAFQQVTENLIAQFEEMRDGLGYHSADIHQLITDLQDNCKSSTQQLNKLALKINKATLIREYHVNTNRYRQGGGVRVDTSESFFGRNGKSGAAVGKQENGISGGQGGSAGQAYGESAFEGIKGKSLLTRKTPRDLAVTQQKFKTESDGALIYNTPIETGEYLCPKQGKARIGFTGTCGLCSCANLLRLAGVNVSEGDVIDYASTTNAPDSVNKLCVTGHWFSGKNGGTDAYDRKEILSHFGIDSGIFNVETNEDGRPNSANIINIAKHVSEGRGVILSVHAHSLWNDDPHPVNDLHAIVVTSVKKSPTGEIMGFYVNDTGKGGTYYYTAAQIQEALSGFPMNVTYQIIR